MLMLVSISLFTCMQDSAVSASASASEIVVNLPYVFHIVCIPPSSRIRIVDFFFFFLDKGFLGKGL